MGFHCHVYVGYKKPFENVKDVMSTPVPAPTRVTRMLSRT